jgi:hypothetical protein
MCVSFACSLNILHRFIDSFFRLFKHRECLNRISVLSMIFQGPGTSALFALVSRVCFLLMCTCCIYPSVHSFTHFNSFSIHAKSFLYTGPRYVCPVCPQVRRSLVRKGHSRAGGGRDAGLHGRHLDGFRSYRLTRKGEDSKHAEEKNTEAM